MKQQITEILQKGWEHSSSYEQAEAIKKSLDIIIETNKCDFRIELLIELRDTILSIINEFDN